ncbi:MAG TPA: UGSC family (seleno)protein [Thermodesulfobacteriota bacterium]|nr:UGSC family (seleno)protein [Thermodesulfobacteriota bacterium]
MDQLNLERLGIPTVTVVTSPFVQLANTIPLAKGFRDACFVQVPPPIGMLASFQIRQKAEDAFDQILSAATDWQPSRGTAVKRVSSPADVLEFSGTVEDMNRHFIEKGWSLGLPVLPPTPERIYEMLMDTAREPGEVLGQVPPRMGTLTVELVAVYAAMAGCRPEYMPVLIAALEGFLTPEANWRLALSGTGTSQLIVIVNGPVVKEIGMGCEQGAAGKGYHANGSIGYAINLIAYAVGGSKPPMLDRSTLASPSDYVCWVFGENERALPKDWCSLHVERGFKHSDSVVTVMAGYPPAENMDHWSGSAEEHMRWWGRIVNPLQNMGGPSVPQVMEQNPLIALGPEHAHLIASTKWSKDDFRRAFWEQTRIPLAVWPSACGREKLTEILGPLTDDSLVPITRRPGQLLLVVAGGDGKQSHYFPPLPGSFPVSRLIRSSRLRYS